MRTAADIQDFLLRLELPYEEPSEGTFVIQGHDGLDNIVLTIAGPVVVFRVKLMEVPQSAVAHREELFRTLLELNATEMMHGAYGVEGNSVVICDALGLENLDFNEFAASIDDISMAVSSHRVRLAKFREAA
jgi:Tir chaperone protein (CesT) family